MLSASLVGPNPDGGIAVGDEAPDFDLLNIDGEMVALNDYADSEGLIVIFTCNHCPFSVAYEDRIIALDEWSEAQGYPVVAINPNDPVQYPSDSYDAMIVRAEEKGFNFPYLFDETQEIALGYGATRTPHVFVLERAETQFICRYIGAIDDNTWEEENVSIRYIEEAVTAIKDGTSPDPDFTKAIGCTIKWKQ